MKAELTPRQSNKKSDDKENVSLTKNKQTAQFCFRDKRLTNVMNEQERNLPGNIKGPGLYITQV